ncbi:MAG TPA: carboxypeptidase-like regulatory domain-containing protein, partial [Bryobacteraceae bacterium]|nr:carboxypeptidase-like regulatory domain-containing protein [Bryobacteraceae bacterium]
NVTALSDSLGQYRFLALPVGRYKVEASAAGFQKFVVTGVTLDVNQQRRIDITLQVGSVEQQVEVSANAVQVETTNTQLGQVIDQKKVLELPLNGRSYIDLLGLQAGVAPTTSSSIQQDRPVSGDMSAGNISVNGQRETANAFLVNGGDVSEGRNLGTAIVPNLDSVAEFRLITNSFDAEYGKFSGAIMNAITKSGTNGFHGSAFEFLRNDKLDARGFFDPEKGVFRRNQFGYAVGGPAIKNKVFWFTDYQGTRQARGVSSGLVQLPSASQREGDFSGLNAFVDSSGEPATVQGPYWAQVLSKRLGYTVTAGEPYSPENCTSTLNCVFPGGVIPQRAFSSPAVAIMKYIPLPNPQTGFLSTAGSANKVVDDKAGQRVDILTQKLGNWFGYYYFDDATVDNPFGASVPGFPTVTPTRAQQGVLSNTKIFGPSMVNEFRVSFMRTSTTTDKPQAGFGKISDFGFVTGIGSLGIIPSGPAGFEGLPNIGFQNFSIGSPTLTTTQPNNTWHFADNFSRIYGRHTMKFGGEFRYMQINERNVCAPNGSFNFDGSETGNDFADYLLGAPSGYTQCSQQFLDSRTRYGAAYAQDSFRVKPNLTLNYGLRWEVNMPWYDTQDKIETIVPGLQSTQFPTAPTGWVVPGDPGVPSTLAPTRYNNLGPRVGLAYSPGFNDGVLGKIFGGPGKTSIRAAFGIYYTSIEDLSLFYEVGDAPYGLYWPSILPPTFEEPFRTRSDGSSQGQRFPFVLPTPGDPANKTLDYSVFLPIQGSPGYDIHNRVPYAEHYNFTIQRSLSNSMVLSLAYVGTQAHRLIAEREANPGNPGLCLSLRGTGVLDGTPECGPFGELGTYTRPDGSIVNSTRGPLGPNFGSDAFTANIANSNYNSLQITLERRAANFTFLAAYTYAKALDNSSGFGEWVNFTNYRLSRALSAFDQTHNFVVSYNYAIPFDRAFQHLPKRLTQGWSINGITRFATGFPIGISQSGDRSLTGSSGVDFPNYVGGLLVSDPRGTGTDGTPNEYFNRSAFTSEALGAMGNANRRFFHGPGFNNWDFGVHKDTKIRESMAVQFRAEFFNIFNHAQFNNPNGNYASSLFGVVTSAKDPRIGQMSLKFLW